MSVALFSRSDAGTLRLSIEHAHARDARIRFIEDSHEYFVDGVKVGLSVTGLLASVDSDPFDADAVSQKIFNMREPHPRYSRAGLDSEGGEIRVRMQPSEIQDLWLQANHLGTDLHGKIERYMNGVAVCIADGDVNVQELAQVIKWWERKKREGFVAHWTEKIIFDEAVDLAGSVDFIMRNTKTGGLVIVDWKRCLTTSSSGFSTAFRGKCLGTPLEHVAATKLNKWSLQVNVYARILERHYDVTIEGMAMVVAHPDNDDVEEYWHDRTDDADVLLEFRRRQCAVADTDADGGPPASKRPHC
jgi:hypothetical protein